MQQAGRAAYDALRRRWPRARRLQFYCGAGNNAGDGWIMARLALDDGLPVDVIGLKAPQELVGDAATAAADYLLAGGRWRAFSAAGAEEDTPVGGNTTGSTVDVVVDALLGTGLSGAPRGDFAAAINALNKSAAPVLAVDIPSGLDGDTGGMPGATVRADLTVTFIARKQGLYTGEGPACCGKIIYAPLVAEWPRDLPIQAEGQLLDESQRMVYLPDRAATAHKGQAGHVLVAGGDEGMPGAVLLAGTAALRAGAGLVTVVTHAAHAGQVVVYRPELMSRAWRPDGLPSSLMERVSVNVLGPGLGQTDWSRGLYNDLMADPRPLLVDADGLNLLAAEAVKRDLWVMTPHPGEAARLLACSVKIVQEDRIAAARAISARYGAVTVLKGAGSVIAHPAGEFMICPYGTPAMATAGMGDVLSGVIGALMAQGLDCWQAACCGVMAHARAGERAGGTRQRGMLASDLFQYLPDELS